MKESARSHTTAYRRPLTGTGLLMSWLAVLAVTPATAQQFNSDNYLSKPAGVATVILTAGQQSTMAMTTFSLLPRWEFTFAAYIYNADKDRSTDDGYSTSLYFKYMLFENAAKTGGIAFKGGTGLEPGYLSSVGLEDAFQTYWVNAPVTLPFLQNRLSWDLMPGASYTLDKGGVAEFGWAFTYSTRVAWYPFSPKLAIVGEVFGGVGEVETIPEYKAGLRYEPDQYATFALTYGHEFNGTAGAGLQIGMMLFTPPFFCISGCHGK
ncbi:MAG: hypothetical protein H6Q77_1044 [Gemmatimonadetes bacterium]|nr:hypothetical protein [Gemmatimonadota bacterium]